MSILFAGPKHSTEARWIVFALLRDNVQHHLEGGAPTAAFEALHTVTTALGGGVARLPARKLHDELVRARDALLHLPIAELALSLRTRSVLMMNWPPPDRRETCLASESGVTIPWVVPEAKSLDEVFGQLVRELIEMTGGATESDQIEVRDL